MPPRDRPSQPKPRRRRIDGAFLFIVVLAVGGGAAVWLRDGWPAAASAAVSESGLLLTLIPRMVAALALAGLVQVLLPREKMGRWLGKRSGLRGLLLATVAGALAPGGPMTSFPLAVALFGAGADLGTTVAFITSWSVLGLNRVLVWEIPFMGSDFALLRLSVSILLPLIAGLLARALPLPPPTLPEGVEDLVGPRHERGR